MSNFDPTEEHVAQVGAGFTDMLSTIEKIRGERYAALIRITFGMYNYTRSVHSILDTIAERDENTPMAAASAALNLAIDAVINDIVSTLMDAITNPDLKADRKSVEYMDKFKAMHEDMKKDMMALYIQQEKLDATTGGKFYPSGVIGGNAG